MREEHVLLLFVSGLTIDAVLGSFALWFSWEMPVVVVVFAGGLTGLVFLSHKINKESEKG